jgi:hypothetical protein
MMTHTTRGHRALSPLETIALTETSWRVCDGTLPEDDAVRLLAYVEQTPTGVEVLWMLPSAGETQMFPTLDDALDAVRGRLPARTAAAA